MKIVLASLCMLAGLSACISSSSPAPPEKSTTVIVPPSASPTVVCSDGSNQPCR